MDRTLDNKDTQDAKAKAKVAVTGNPDIWELLCKASCAEQGWMKSTKAMEIEGRGCLVQVTTQQGAHVSESLTWVPNVEIRDDGAGNKRLCGY